MKHTTKILYILFFIALSPLHITPSTQSSGAQPIPHNINVTTTPNYTTNISPTINTTTTSTIHAVGMQMRDIGLHIMEKAQQTFTKDNYNSAKELLQNLIWHYRYNIVVGTGLTAYGTTSLLLSSDYHYLTHATRWSRWKSDYNFEMLCSVSPHELEQELIRAIGEHHVNKKNPTDLSHPLITFIETIEHEIKTCKRYLSIAQTIKRLHLSTIFPTNDTKIAAVAACLERALFIKHIFLSWLTERNLITTSRKKVSVQWPL